ncbi:hypothetical protein K2X40_00840 [Candidatus Babeliales bacterium]|nr:hypothetical protein [Candidatus Babeliales bacterium]
MNSAKSVRFTTLALLIAAAITSQAQPAATSTNITVATNAFNSIISRTNSSLKNVGYTGTTTAQALANLTAFIQNGLNIDLQNANQTAVAQAQTAAKNLKTQIALDKGYLDSKTAINIQKVISDTASTGALGKLSIGFFQSVRAITMPQAAPIQP